MDGVLALPDEMLQQILIKTEPMDILNVCHARSNIRGCNDEFFLQQVANTHYPSVTPFPNMTWKHLLQIISHNDIERGMVLSVAHNNLSLSEYYLKLMGNNKQYESLLLLGFKTAIHERNVAARQWFNKQIVKLIPDVKVQFWNAGMIAAIITKQKYLMRRYIRLGMNIWNKCIKVSVKTRDTKIIKFLLQEMPYEFRERTLNTGLITAAKECDKELVCHFMDLGATNIHYALNAMINAHHDNEDMINFLINNGATNFNFGLETAISSGYMLSFQKFIELQLPAEQNITAFYNKLLLDTVKAGEIDMIKYLIEKGANNLNNALFTAIMKNNDELIHYLISIGANDWSHAHSYAARYSDKTMRQFFMQKRLDDLDNKVITGQ